MCLLKMKGIVKSFPGVLALDGVDFELRAGEVHALLGENGAGKSTLIKILSGAHPCDGGEIFLEGRPIEIRNPSHANSIGIRTIYQEINLVPTLTVAENIYLGRLPRTPFGGIVKKKELIHNVVEVLNALNIDLDPKLLVRDLSVAQKQIVEIAKALSQKTKILIMDEPTSTLTSHEIENLFALVRHLKSKGVGVVYISHRLEEIDLIGDRVTVLRDGKKIRTLLVADTNHDELIQLMIGRRLEEKYPKRQTSPGDEILKVEHLTLGGVFQDISFRLHRGEILGVMGVVGSGTEAIAHSIAGALPYDRGEKYVAGAKVEIHSPQDAIRNRLGLLPEDRKGLGLVLKLSVKANITLANLGVISKKGWLNLAEEEALSRRYVEKLNIVAPSSSTRTENLSGGNQQKVVLAKWLCKKADILLCIEPTRGVDIGARVEIYALMNELAREGGALAIFSSDLDEVLGMSDRIIVISKGRLVAELPRNEFSRQKVISYAFGELSHAAADKAEGSPSPQRRIQS
ncbi:MAG TPA: sugar ABC transporter ATP-binding protein [Thermodesulfobacteriota bacterium]|nr:sugar ABC transporter ATP-binding protein [Thermodesulfobacteriota bacterium]